MKSLLVLIEKIENAGAFLAALSMGLLFLIGLAEIVMRGVFSASIPISLEYSGYLVAASFLMGTGWTLREGKHVRVSLIKVPGSIKILMTAVALIIALMLSYGLISWTIGSFMRGSVSYFPSATALWMPLALFSLGPVILATSLLGRLIRQLTGEDVS